MNPCSFWARVIRGLYFPNGSFMTAKKGRKASWFWNSILQGREVLLADMRWQVGDGFSINFCCNKWFPSTPEFFIPEAKGPFPNSLCVSHFIKNGIWDLEKLGSVISAPIVNDISLIPISRTGAHDKLVWRIHYQVWILYFLQFIKASDSACCFFILLW